MFLRLPAVAKARRRPHVFPQAASRSCAPPPSRLHLDPVSFQQGPPLGIHAQAGCFRFEQKTDRLEIKAGRTVTGVEAAGIRVRLRFSPLRTWPRRNPSECTRDNPSPAPSKAPLAHRWPRSISPSGPRRFQRPSAFRPRRPGALSSQGRSRRQMRVSYHTLSFRTCREEVREIAPRRRCREAEAQRTLR